MPAYQSQDRSLVFVDDEPLILECFGQLLRMYLSCPVHTFSSPEEALNQLPSLNPGVVLSDYSMPRMNGVQFLSRAQEMMPGIHTIILTGEPVEFGTAELHVLPSLKGILRKPIHWKELAEFIVHNWPEETAAPVLHEPAMAM